MKNVYRLNSNWNDNTSEYDLVNLVENRKFISSTTKEVDITSQLNVVSLDSSMIQDASFYRYPKLTLPRTKVDILKEKFNISITRAEDKADYKIISDSESRPNLYVLDLKTVMKYRKIDKKGTPYLLLSSLPNREEYKENWDQIRKFLKVT